MVVVRHKEKLGNHKARGKAGTRKGNREGVEGKRHK